MRIASQHQKHGFKPDAIPMLVEDSSADASQIGCQKCKSSAFGYEICQARKLRRNIPAFVSLTVEDC
jgi:hypothetical protein